VNGLNNQRVAGKEEFERKSERVGRDSNLTASPYRLLTAVCHSALRSYFQPYEQDLSALASLRDTFPRTLTLPLDES
jgi:hypothetical protein